MLWRSAHFWGSALNVRQQSRRLLIAFSKSPWATGIRRVLAALFLLVLATLMSPAFAAAPPATPVYALGIPVDFILFGLALLGVALFHRHTLPVALISLAAIAVYKLMFTGFKTGAGLAGLALHVQHEWVILANLFLLLTGFAILSRHFEESRIPDGMPALLPDDWKGGLALLAVVFVLSGFLDNIAAALIGGTMARHVFQGRVHIATLPRLLLHPMLAVRAASLATLRPR
jgi:hypothetical protein